MKPPRAISRLSVRLLAFHLLLVFLPLAAVSYLGSYESRLESAEVRSITEQAHMLAAVLGAHGMLDAKAAGLIVDRIGTSRSGAETTRLRVLNGSGDVIADSHRIATDETPHRVGSPRHNTLYRIGAFLVRPVVRLVQPPELPLETDPSDDTSRMSGADVLDALHGRDGFEKKITAGGKRSVTLFRTVPVLAGERVVGAVVASRSTFTILQDLYAVRLSVLRIFLAAVIVAILVSVLFSTTIVKPLRQLRVDARSILDRRGRIRDHFKGSRRLDEIGELSRALERIVRRLDGHVKSMETFAADVSHEFRNPLASIRTANEMLADVNDPADRRRFVRMVEQEVARMEKLLSGVREISTIDAQLGGEAQTQVLIGELLAKIIDGFRLRLGERVVFELDVQTAPLVVQASEDRLIQVFENVLDNAVSFSPAGGTVTVRVNSDGNRAITRIEDGGPGIPETHLQKIFDRFFTYRPATAWRDSRHSGLGLAIALAIVRGYGGTIVAQNGERGAAFVVAFPMK